MGRRNETRPACANPRFENQAVQNQQISLQSATRWLSRFHTFESPFINAVLRYSCARKDRLHGDLELIETIYGSVIQFRETASLADDLTLVVLRKL